MVNSFDNISVGVDIERVDRFLKYKNPEDRFVKRIFTDKEIEYCYKTDNFASHLAARYCAKEALYKAFSALDVENIHLKDFEILNKANGVPYVVLKGDIEKYSTRISLSHTRDNAIASVVIYKIEP